MTVDEFTIRPLPRFDVQLAAAVLAHLDAETERECRVRYYLEKPNGGLEEHMVTHRRKKINRFALACMMIYQLTGRCHLSGRHAVSPHYVYLDRTNKFVAQNLFVEVLRVINRSFLLDDNEEFEDFMQCAKYCMYYEGFRRQMAQLAGFWVPGNVYRQVVTGPSSNYTMFFKVMNFCFNPT